MQKSTNITWQQALVTRDAKARLNVHHSVVVWQPGLPGSGKSTLAHAVEKTLHALHALAGS